MTRSWLAYWLIAAAFWDAIPNTVVSGERWVATWGCAPQLIEPSNLPPPPGLAHSTLRQVVRVSIGGKRLRVRFSNAYGTESITLTSAHVALAAGGSAIRASTDRAVAFRRASAVTILPGEEALSDPLEYDLPPLAGVVVSISFGQTSDRVTGHPGSRATSYLQAGDAVSAISLPAAVETTHWYILTSIEVQAADSSAAVIALGDSITDGRGSRTDANDRWPDYLAMRLSTNVTTAAVALVNQGIGGNAVVVGGLGPTAIARFERDVLQQPGARWLVLLEGVNDIGLSSHLGVATDLIAAYQQFITKAHLRGIRAYAIPVLPFGGSRYSSAIHEAARQTVNHWIRTSGKFDAVIDLDAAVRDPQNPTNLLPRYDSGDHLHLNGAGYRRMADLIDLSLFTQ